MPLDDSYEPRRRMLRQMKWWIVISVFVLLGAWQWAVHRWFMGLPMLWGHRLSALGGAAIVASAMLAFLFLVQQYEDDLANGARILSELDRDLRHRSGLRGQHLRQLARELIQLGEELGANCQQARNSHAPGDAVKALAALETRTEELGHIGCALRRLIEEDERVENLPTASTSTDGCGCPKDVEAREPAALDNRGEPQ